MNPAMLSVMSVHRDAFLHHLPRRQTRTLQERAGFVGDDGNALSRLDRRANHTERRAVARRRQRAGIAVREHPGAIGQERRAMFAQRAVRADVLLEDLVGLRQQRVGLGRRRIGRERFPLQAHALERPEEVDGGGPAGRQNVKAMLHGAGERRACRMAVPQGFKRYTEGGRTADGGCAAHHHLANPLRHRLGTVIAQVAELGRQDTLVDHFQVPVAPTQRLHASCLRRCHGVACLPSACGP